MMTRRSAVITGASTGIGRATAELLAGEGYDLWITYSSFESEAEITANLCRGAGAGEVRISQLALQSPESIERFAEEVEETWSAVDVLINNGGVCPYTEFFDISLEEWDWVMNINCRGMFLMTRRFLPLVRASAVLEPGRDRSIINISSTAGQSGSAHTGIHYSASKAAVLAITRSFARILAPERIRVNSIAPGPVFSVMASKVPDEGRKSMEAALPFGHFGKPEDVAWVVGTLASPKAGFVTGATYDVNGGVLMG